MKKSYLPLFLAVAVSLSGCLGTEESDSKTTSGNVTVKNKYLQYRNGDQTYSDLNKYTGFIELDQGTSSDIASIKLTRPNGTTVSPISVDYRQQTYRYGEYNATQYDVIYNDTDSFYKYYTISYSKNESMPAGTYTYEITKTSGDKVTTNLYFPGQYLLSYVDDMTMNAVKNPDGSITFGWEAASGGVDFDKYSLEIYDTSTANNEVIRVMLPNTFVSLTIPAQIVDETIASRSLSEIKWRIVTRWYDGNNMNAARGMTPYKTFSL